MNSQSQGTAEHQPLDVTVAVVSHRHYRFLEGCLSSIFANTRRVSLEVVLVDNVGQPEIAQLIETKFPQVRLIVNQTRMGFAANNNQAIVPSTARYSFLLNPDTVVQPEAIDKLVEFMDCHPRVGACGPKLIYADGRLQLSCRQFPSLKTVLLRRTPLRLLFRKSSTAARYTMADWDHKSSLPVDWLFGAAIMIRRKALQSVGPLDERMFMYSEDVDWCLRCHQAGWDVYYAPDAVILHYFGDEKYDRYFTKHRFMHYKSMLQYLCKHWRHCLR